MSNLLEHARGEFRAAGWMDAKGNYVDEMQGSICEHILALLKVFTDEGHSGSTAPYTVDVFKKLAMFQPLTPLTGEDWEWIDHGHCLQNKRCSHVFKQPDRFDGQAYDIEAVVFYDWYTDENGEKFKSYFSCGDSHQPIIFPYTPKTEYKERIE